MLLIHFTTNDIEKMASHGKFWHLHIGNEASLIHQDAKNTFTMHIPVPPGESLEVGDNPEEFIKKQLGGWGRPFDIKVDEIGMISKWEASVALANSFRSSNGRVFLSGDSGRSNLTDVIFGRVNSL
jgi:FAD-dependent monooxygenase